MIALLLLFVFMFMSTFTGRAEGVEYYIAPSGVDTNSGLTSALPWKTWDRSFDALFPGDVLNVMSGTYTVAANGVFNAGCTGASFPTGARDGTVGSVITVKAVSERQALIQGAGNNVVRLNGCEYWVLEGLYVRNIDANVGGFEGSLFVFQSSSNIVLRKSLGYGPNAWFNSHGIALYTTHNSLIEDNEVYYVARHGIVIGEAGTVAASGNTVRRNYFHSRSHADMIGGYVSAPGCGTALTRGDEGVSCYPCKNSVIENNIIEGFDAPFTIQCKNDCGGNSYYGNITLGCGCGGIGFTARGENFPNQAQQMPTNEVIVNHVSYNSSIGGGGCTSCKNLQVDHYTSLNNNYGFQVKIGTVGNGENGDGVSTFTGKHMLITGSTGLGVNVTGQTTWSLDKSLLFNNTGGYTPVLTDGHYSNIVTSDPVMGGCIVFVPVGSPAKGAGEGGSDIGASVIYRYVDGVLTATPLWDVVTGKFPCGVVVTGVNDVVGSSCTDVNVRLNVNSGGCMLPTAGAGDVVTGLVSWWPFNSSFADVGSNSNHGSGVATPLFDVAGNCKVGTGCLLLNGSTQSVTVPQGGEYVFNAHAFSVAVWVKDDTSAATMASTGNHRVVSWYDGVKNVQVVLGSNDTVSRRFFIVHDSVDSAKLRTNSVVSTGWNHIVATFDGTGVYHLYLNGVLDESSDVTAKTVYVTESNTLYIGQRGGGVNFISGAVDDVRVYDRVLSTEDVAELFTFSEEVIGQVGRRVVAY